MEEQVAILLNDLAISYTRPDQNGSGGRLDFYLPTFNLYIETKEYACERMVSQIDSVKGNVMVLCGRGSVGAFRKLLLHSYLKATEY